MSPEDIKAGKRVGMNPGEVATCFRLSQEVPDKRLSHEPDPEADRYRKSHYDYSQQLRVLKR